MSCEYLIASLPALSFGEPPPLTAAQLLETASGKVSERDLAVVAALLRGENADHPFAKAWAQAETQVRNAVARARAARLGLQPEDAARWQRPHSGPWRVAIEDGVTAAFAQPGPMERHLALQRLRWDLAGELAGLSPFSAEALFAYAVRLAILADLAAADAEKGLAALKAAASAQAQAADGGEISNPEQTT